MTKQLAPLNNVFATVTNDGGALAARGFLIAVTCDLDQNPIGTLYLFAELGRQPRWVNSSQVESATVSIPNS